MAHKGEALQAAARALLQQREAEAEAAESDPVVQSTVEEMGAEATNLAAETRVEKVFELLATLGYEGDRATQALTGRGYDPEALTVEQAEAIVEKLSAQAKAQKKAA